MQIELTGSVGDKGKNATEDVVKVQKRLNDLGFTFVGKADGVVGSKTIRGIKLFQSIKSGSQTLRGEGLIDKGGDTHKWLNASNAPVWIELPESGDGFVNIEVQDAKDKHDFGTSWLKEAIVFAGSTYKTNYLTDNTANLITINDASHPDGGNTKDHKGHETGLSCDLRLPVTNGNGAAPPGTTIDSKNYDRTAARAMIKALRNAPNHSLIYFNDSVLIKEGLCKQEDGHHNHMHFEIKAPERKD